MDEVELRTLRAKYLDWCSARLADRFLDLTPEEIYELARPEPNPERGAERVLPLPADDSYTALVQRVTESLLGRIALPAFDTWRENYARAPDRFDAEMLGFWREASGGRSGGSGRGGGSGP